MGSTREPLLGRGASTPVILGRGLEVPLREILAKTPRVRPAGASCALLVGLLPLLVHQLSWSLSVVFGGQLGSDQRRKLRLRESMWLEVGAFEQESQL